MSEKPKRGYDPELQTMAKIDRLLSERTEDEVSRILAWLVCRHSDRPIQSVEEEFDLKAE